MEHYSILLADDDHDDCLLFGDALSDLSVNANLTVVNDGAELMAYFSNTSNSLPSVLFLDLNMPRKSGMECLKELKSNSSLEKIPVVVYSTSLLPEVLNVLYHEGADYCIVKPPDFGDLKNVIGRALDRAVFTKGERRSREGFLIQP